MLKKLIAKALFYSGAWRLFRLRQRYALTILLYHGVAPAKKQGIYNYRGKFIPPSAFAEQLEFIKKHYHVLPLDEAVERLYDGSLPPYSLAITFDDGYRNLFTHAFPALKRAGLTATFFVVTSFIFERVPLWVDRLEILARSDDQSVRAMLKTLPDEAREQELARMESRAGKKLADYDGAASVYAPLTLDEMREMRAAGMAFGAHTENHPILTRLSPERLESEIAGSKRRLEEALGSISNVFCYPNGTPADFNPEVIKATKRAGFEAAVTTIQRTNSEKTPPFELNRFVMDGVTEPWQIATTISGAMARLKNFRKS